MIFYLLVFFIAPLKELLLPYMAVYLKTNLSYDSFTIGKILAISSFCGIISQIPIGFIIDKLKNKLLIIQLICLLLFFITIGFINTTNLGIIFVLNSLFGLLAGILGPLIAALTLIIFNNKAYGQKISINETIFHISNVLFTLIVLILGKNQKSNSIFILFAFLAIISSILPFKIKIKNEILDSDTKDIKNKNNKNTQIDISKLIFLIISIFLFHLANAALLPNIGLKLAQLDRNNSFELMNYCIMIAQLIMILTSFVVIQLIDKISTYKLYLLTFIILSLRAYLFSICDNINLLILFQALDGISASLFSISSIILIKNLSQKNLTFYLCISGAAIGTGSSLSNYLSGYIINQYGFNINFLILTFIAIFGFLVSLFSLNKK